MNSDVKIYVCHHKEYWTCKTDIIEPIQVGKANSSLILNMIGDDTGENISHRNPNFCELTAMYWAWKNVKHDYIGFCHYRRYLSFLDYPESVITLSEINQQTLEHTKIYDDNAILDAISNTDIIVPKKFNHEPFTVSFQYLYNHIKEDWDIMINVLLEKYPESLDLVNKVLYEGKEMYPFNMFIMNYEIFNIYMEWLFDILFEVEKRIFISQYPYQARVFGFMAERLFSLFIAILNEKIPLRIKEVNTVYFNF
ncbi:MAG: DUF4422 domain-containing protein [bacterium]